jgi:hypothetical protein
MIANVISTIVKKKSLYWGVISTQQGLWNICWYCSSSNHLSECMSAGTYLQELGE